MTTPQDKKLIVASGIIGPLFLLLYFGVPALFPKLAALLYGSAPTDAQVVAIGAQYHTLLSFGAWLQGAGALLCVVFFLGLVRLVKGGDTLAAPIVLLGSAVLVAVVTGEMVFTFTWVSAAILHQASVAQTSYSLMSRFIQVFPIVPAPAVYLALAGILRRGQDILRPLYGYLAFVLGSGFVAVGLAGIFTPIAGAGSAILAGLQSMWILAAALSLLRYKVEPQINT